MKYADDPIVKAAVETAKQVIARDIKPGEYTQADADADAEDACECALFLVGAMKQLEKLESENARLRKFITDAKVFGVGTAPNGNDFYIEVRIPVERETPMSVDRWQRKISALAPNQEGGKK